MSGGPRVALRATLTTTTLLLALTACDSSPGSTTTQVVGGDCRHAALGCAAGYACVAQRSGEWACVPEGDAAPPIIVSDAGGEGPKDTATPPPDDGPDIPATPLGVELGVEGAVLSGITTVVATPTAGAQILGCEFHVDGTTVGTDVIPPYVLAINTAIFSDGAHTLTVDTATVDGQTASAKADVIFDNTPPEFQTLSPPDGATVFFEDGPLTMTATVADAGVVDHVEFRANGLLVGEFASPPFMAGVAHEKLFLDVESLPKNVYLQFRAEDSLGQVTELAHNVEIHKRMLWEYETLGEIWGSAVALPSGNIVFGNLDEKLIAVTPDGAKVWELAVGGDVTYAPAVDPDTGNIYYGTLEGTLRATNQNGGNLWTQTLGSPPGGEVRLAGDKVYIATFDGNVYARNKSNGSVVWQTTLPAFVTASPTVGEDGRVYVGCQDNKLYAIVDGTPIWSVPTGGEVWSSATIGIGNTVYFGSNDGWVYAVKDGGDTLWELELEGQIWGRLLLEDDLSLYIASTSKHVRKVSALDGSTIWDVKLAGMTYSSPVRDADGTVYVGTTTGQVFALDPETGATRFVIGLEDTIHATPLLAGDRLYIGTTGRSLYSMWRWGVDLSGSE